VDLPEIIGGKYRPKSVLGTGGTGTVYCVEHTTTGELLALKVMNSHLGASADAIARFKREARAASKIRSAHVVRIFDADLAAELGNAPYLVMDLLEGSDLDQLADNKPVDPEDLVEWLRQIALALDKAHRMGIVHRDLKPENLFLTRLDDGTPLLKILDFGIAKITADAPGSTTQSGQLFGTPLYMAPEQAWGDPRQIGPATDLFALGQIAYTLLTGTAYRRGTTLTELLHEILNEPLQSPTDRGQALGAGFDAWFVRACHPDPKLRFGSARQQVEALAAALGLPSDPEAAPLSPSSIEPWESLPVDSVKVSTSANGAVVLDAMARQSLSGVPAGPRPPRIQTLPTPADPQEPAHAVVSARAWRTSFFAAATLVVILLAILGFAKGKSTAPVAAAASPPMSCPLPAPVYAVATAPSPVVSPVAAAVVESPKPTVTAARTPERETARAVAPPPRPAIARSPVARAPAAEDDVLGDQK
jgi:serine/threonine-protein kinase